MVSVVPSHRPINNRLFALVPAVGVGGVAVSFSRASYTKKTVQARTVWVKHGMDASTGTGTKRRTVLRNA